MATCKSSYENTGKMNLIPVLNKTSPRAHTELELDELGVPGKLVKYVVHSSKEKKLKKNYFSSLKLLKLQSTNSWSQSFSTGPPQAPHAKWVLEGPSQAF
jgi:hypothetical protein